MRSDALGLVVVTKFGEFSEVEFDKDVYSYRLVCRYVDEECEE